MLLRQESLRWSWVAVGFVTFFVATGPVADSPVGQLIGDWFRAIGRRGRAAVIVLFAIAADALPDHPLESVGVGLVCAAPLFVGLYVLTAGQPDGWCPE